MLTYKNLYCSLVRSMSEAIDLYDEGKGILARETLHKALSGRRRPSHLPRHHPRRTYQQLPPQLKTKKRGERSNAAPAGSLPPVLAVTRASR